MALTALAAGDLVAANALSPVPLTPTFVASEWRGTWRRRAEQVAVTPADLDWVTGVAWDEDHRLAVGRAGFHAAPDEQGTVEVGYAVDPAYRRRGYGRATLATMLERARADPRLVRVLASVAPDNVASLALVAEAGFVRIGEQWDDEDGLEWVFELRLDQARAAT
jgi:RimJ/RimL family protein N-acetyltransferase